MKRTKPARRARIPRDARRRRVRRDRLDAVDLAWLDERLRRAGPDGSWEDVRPLVLPVLARAHQPIATGIRLIRVRLPPGLWVGFGIDLGPAFTHIAYDQLERWAIDEPELVATAMANLERRAETDELELSSLVIDGVPLMAVQASGWGSALLLAPATLSRILGPGVQLVFAPVRNTILAVPLDAPTDLVSALWTALAEDEPTELDGGVYRLEGGLITAIARGQSGGPPMPIAAGRPN
jgi:hypothetical protein